MKRIILFFALGLTLHFSFAQDADALHEQGRTLMQQGDLDKALALFDSALHLKPNDLEILKDIAFTNYFKRDFATSIEIGKKIIARPDADVQSFQVLGYSYKATVNVKDGDKMYKAGLKKFPKSGMLYSEYGDLLASANNYPGAIALWEKGIEIDPNASSNYYYAAKYYATNKKWIWALYYGETFVNIESFTSRTTEMKNILYNCYKNFFAGAGNVNKVAATATGFEKALATTYADLTTMMSDDLSPENITALRTRFILEWFSKNAKQFPCRLFDHQRLLLQQGYFEAYNQWLIGPVANAEKLQDWMNNHSDDVKSLQQFQHSALYKVPAGQYYPH